MNNFKVINKNFEVVDFDNKDYFVIKNKVEEIFVYDEELINSVIDKKFMKNYKKILYIISDIDSSDDATETDIILVRDEIERLKEILIKKYSNYLTKDKLNRYLKMISLLSLKVPRIKSRGR